MPKKYIIGIDEVGRGCLAGPVVVCAALAAQGRRFFNKKLGALRDSKKTSPRMREEWFLHLKKTEVIFAIARVSPSVIDKTNISRAANIAAERALKRLLLSADIREEEVDIFLDGGLYVGERGSNIGKTIIKGDEKIKVISAASILAKVYRDKLMSRYALKFKDFNFNLNKGYGTAHHIKILKSKGATSIHRKTFISNFV
ncbi:MAG: Ribonuclease HII [Parcubacteria group bacterium GW2011_GWC1_43_12]|nr:MAG: Ribonuclease HII [Parcubacteria group bacterium GW2011_GWC1_43_12]